MAQLMREDVKNRKVEVNREKLLDILRSNKQKHINDYREALQGYKEMALEKLQDGYEKAKVKLEKNLERGKTSIAEFDPENPRGVGDYLTLIEGVSVELKVPRDFSKDYDAAIDMAKWDVRETLELSNAEFQCFVRDVWDWTNDFVAVSKMYKMSK